MKKITILSLLLLVFFACRKDIDEIVDLKTISKGPEIINEYSPNTRLLTASIEGYVFDETKDPIQNAIVTLRGNNYTTDTDGRFYASDIEMDGEGTFFTVEKEGYFKGSRRFFPEAGVEVFAQVQMMELNVAGKFATENGGVVNGADGISLSFPENAIKIESGGLYSGEVSVAAKWLDPTADNVDDLMPGTLRGVNNSLEEVGLVSFGMMAVELFGENGEKLNIADGKKAELSFPVPASILADAPAEIPLWYFEDEKYGIWAEDGKATLVNGKYVGEVTHFSFWNCDGKIPLIRVSGNLLSSLNKYPIPLERINAEFGKPANKSYGYTDANGFFTGMMPKDAVIKLTFGDPTICNLAPVFIGPFDQNTTIDEIIVMDHNVFEITGDVLTCDGFPITYGSLDINYGNRSTTLPIFEQNIHGTNTFSFGLLNCESATEFSIAANDPLTEGYLDTFTIIPHVNVAELSTCGDAVPYYFNYQLENDSVAVPEDFFWATTHIDSLYPDNLHFGFSLNGNTQQEISAIIEIKESIPGSYTFANNDFKHIYLGHNPPVFPNCYLNCFDVSSCFTLEYFHLNIEVNEGPGGIVKGNFVGEGDFRNPDTNEIYQDLRFSGYFRILHD